MGADEERGARGLGSGIERGALAQAVLRRDIPWSTYMSARLLDDKNLQLIRKFDKKCDATQDALLKEVRGSI